LKRTNCTIYFLFLLLFLSVVNFDFAQTRVWIEDSSQYSPPYPKIGWDSLKSRIIYPEIYTEAGVEQSQTIVVYISITGEVDSIMYGKMYTGFSQPVNTAIYSTKWIPGKFKGVPIDTSITIPISFKLYDGENAPPMNIVSARKLKRGHWEYLLVFIDTTCVSVPDERP
jgi:hypothetical protein